MRIKFKSTWLIKLANYTNVLKSFEMTLNAKHWTEKLKTEKPKIQKDNQNTERWKPNFTKRIGEWNNDHIWIIHKMKFCSSFNDINDN